MIKLYTIGCPKCNILEEKLDAKNIKYEKCEDKDIMISKNMDQLPILEVDDELMNYSSANAWVNAQ